MRSIKAVEAAAQRAGVRAGDQLFSINGEPVYDSIDYAFLSEARNCVLRVRRDGEMRELPVRRRANETLGLHFDQEALSTRCCINDCVFCFVDQLPPGLRPSLRVKDDDWRLSLTMGNFVTLTNVGPRELARIIARKASPLYISVHATAPEERRRMLRCERAEQGYAQLQALAQGGIHFHAQVVLCPGYNDGAVLERTFSDLYALYPACESVALVPVGMTAYRKHCAPLARYTPESAAALLDWAEDKQARLLRESGERFLYCADEFYTLARRAFPPEEAYEGYPQLENGVGLCRQFIEAYTAAQAAETRPALPRTVCIATGQSAQAMLHELLHATPIPGVDIRLLAVENRLFGASVTVAGLLGGADIARAARAVDWDELLLPRSMLRAGETVFLDDWTVADLQEALCRPVRVVDVDGAALFAQLHGRNDKEYGK